MWLLNLLAKLIAPLMAYLWAREGEAKRKAQDDAKAAIERNKIEDDLSKHPSGHRRRLLSQWSVSGVEADKTDNK